MLIGGSHHQTFFLSVRYLNIFWRAFRDHNLHLQKGSVTYSDMQRLIVGSQQKRQRVEQQLLDNHNRDDRVIALLKKHGGCRLYIKGNAYTVFKQRCKDGGNAVESHDVKHDVIPPTDDHFNPFVVFSHTIFFSGRLLVFFFCSCCFQATHTHRASCSRTAHKDFSTSLLKCVDQRNFG